MTPSHTSQETPLARDPVEELAEAFLERFRRGERPSLSEFIARAPEHAQEIRELFPALVLMEQAEPAFKPAAVCHLERLGDYRLIREVGRGGMGIVYEAEQEALGRHVALKILPLSAVTDGKSLMRFRREARSAARLHHTNIVPVFDIGERDGIHYYAMQFIQGQGLDEVITELHRLRRLPRPGQAAPPGAVSLAEGLLSGTFQGAEPARGTPTGGAPASPGTSGAAADVGEMRDTSGSVRTDRSDFTGKSEVHFYRSVARVGLQVAEALAYAHGQRVLHRDIKPSNLLLDAAGIVWVTDFGLAKEEGDDLTRTGDIVGTLRYMAPERLSGTSEPRSDVYGLGVTLYELLTLQPAFAETDRARLVQCITRQEPVTPHKLDPHVPRDLETIILKAIAKEPGSRYTTADDMAEDLRLFLMDRPIRARRTSQLERTWRWCRRNPGWAATIATVLLLLLFIAVGGSVLSLHLQRALNDAQAADEEKTEKLWQAHVERAHALRSSGRVGQRFEALKAIREAAKIKVTPRLRDEAVAALVLPDVELEQEWEGYPSESQAFAYDATFDRYARINKQGQVTICQRTPSGEKIIKQLPLHETGPNGLPIFMGMWMSPNGKHLVYGYSFKQGPAVADRLRIWKLDGPSPTYWEEPAGFHLFAVSFAADSRRLALGDRLGVIRVYDLESQELLYQRRLGQRPNTLAFHPQGNLLAVACNDAVHLIDIAADRELPPLRLPTIKSWSFGLAWHPEGRLLAATSHAAKIHIWDTHTAAEAMPPLEGRTIGIVMAFNPKGDRLLSAGDDAQVRLWDLQTGRLLLTTPGRYGVQFSPDGKQIGLEHVGTKVRLWRLADGRELRTIRRRGAERTELLMGPVLHGDGNVMAAASSRGLAFFDLDSGNQLAFAEYKNDLTNLPTTFDSTGGWMTTRVRAGSWLWPARRDPAHPEVLHVGPPQRFAAFASEPWADASADGRIRAVPQGDHTLVYDRDRPGRPQKLGKQFDVRFCAVSPDGTWVATCSWHSDLRSKSVRIWKIDKGTHQHVLDLPLEGESRARFSPDGRWLATQTPGGTRLWEVGTWRAGQHFNSSFCWNTDGRLLAVHEFSVIRLVEPESGKEIIRLTGPDACWYTTVCMTRDGARVLAQTTGHDAVYVWELRLIRKGLQELGMDWDWPEFPPAATPKIPVTAVEVDAGAFRRSVFENDHIDVAAYSTFLAVQPINPEAYFKRGLAYGRLNKLDEAMADYEMFLAWTPNDDRRRPAVLHDYALRANDGAWAVVGAKAPQKTALLDAALRLARKAVELEPENFFYQNTLGVALYRLGQHEQAVACLEKNVPHSQQYVAFDLYFLAMSHHHLGQPARAREYFDRANASAAAETGLWPGHRQELAAFRAEAEKVLGFSK
jgi:serine/threonine protein kinase/WD40 repeat protein